MRVDAPYRDFLGFWERAAGAPRAEQERLWESLYAGPNRQLMDHYMALFGDSCSLGDALDRFGEVADALDARFEGLRLERRAAEVAALLDAPEAPWAIAMVGLFTADAWADDLDGTAAAFFALERLPHPEVIAAHEFAHASHRLARAEYWSIVPALILLSEGVALATTLELQPDAPPERHFLVDDFDRWRGEREADWTHAVDALLACLEPPELRQVQRFFWPDWGRADRDVPERVGYLIAARIMDVLLGERDLAAIARWPAERAVPEVRAALESVR